MTMSHYSKVLIPEELGKSERFIYQAELIQHEAQELVDPLRLAFILTHANDAGHTVCSCSAPLFVLPYTMAHTLFQFWSE